MENNQGIDLSSLRPKGQKIGNVSSAGAYRIHEMIQELAAEAGQLKISKSPKFCQCLLLDLMRNGCKCGGV